VLPQNYKDISCYQVKLTRKSYYRVNWRGKPLTSYAVIVKLIAATTTEACLTVQCQLDTNRYLAGRKVSDEEMATLSLLPDTFHGQWNYTILPRLTQSVTIIL
jgi:hypothetical protein